jgi:hypothetical protein
MRLAQDDAQFARAIQFLDRDFQSKPLMCIIPQVSKTAPFATDIGKDNA